MPTAPRTLDRGWLGTAWRWDFPTGYGVSVAQGPHTQGGPAGYYELAVLRDGRPVYDTPIADRLVGWLDWRQVQAYVARVEALPAERPATVYAQAVRVAEIN